MRSKVSQGGEAWKAPVSKAHKEEVGAAFQSAHNSSGWDRKARWQRAVSLAKAKMGISGPDESIDKWGPASKDSTAAEDPDRRRASTLLNRRGSMSGVADSLAGLGRGAVHGIAELRTPVALKEHLKRGKGVRESGGGILLATLEVGWEAPLCEEDAAALVEKWEARRQMLGAAPMSPNRGSLMSPAGRALRAWTNANNNNNSGTGAGTDNSGGPGTPASGGPLAGSSNNSPAALTAAAAAAGRGIVPLRRFSETGSSSMGGSGGSFPSMRRSGVFDSIVARRQPQLLDGAGAGAGLGAAGLTGSPGELGLGLGPSSSTVDGSPTRYASPLHLQDSGGGAGGGLAGNSAPGEVGSPRLQPRASVDGSGAGGRGPQPLMAQPTFGRQRLQPMAAEGSGLGLGLGLGGASPPPPPLPPLPPPSGLERAGSILQELSSGGETSEAGVQMPSLPAPEAPPPAPQPPAPPPPLVPMPPAQQPDSPSAGGGGGGGRRHRMSRSSLPGDMGGSQPNSYSGATPGPAAPPSVSLPSPLSTLPDDDCPAPTEPAPEAAPGPPPAAPAPPRLTSAHGPLRPTAPASPSFGRYSASGALPHSHPHPQPHPHGPHVSASPSRQHSPATGTVRRSSHQGVNLVLAAAGGGGGGGMSGGGLNVQGTGLSVRPAGLHGAPHHSHPLQHLVLALGAAGGGGGGLSGGGSPAVGSPASSSPMRLSHAALPPRRSINGALNTSFGSTGSGGGSMTGPTGISIRAPGNSAAAAAAAAVAAVAAAAAGGGGGGGTGGGGGGVYTEPGVSSPAGSGVRQPVVVDTLLTGLRVVAAEAADEMVREAEVAAAQRAAVQSARARAAAATADLNTNLNGLRLSDTGSASGRGARFNGGAPQYPGDPWRKYN
ncbi:hypothetical protein HYH02_006255 [Chlamydomonas schloesseri]|uniref:Uncharacterized protein n=1 Tax=Chlamydomonas schloesseri TaxID=2026947 RepID=A0A835WK68_9CHLO|nr:hypothetical protein HYH02_006255 [Chlamydomonas schloesseri]|eukprot:KAG2448907.1 hypothetical protein HYH02_006255 [Chlamydomonas schloesseri]